jgi:hypothetical protein
LGAPLAVPMVLGYVGFGVKTPRKALLRAKNSEGGTTAMSVDTSNGHPAMDYDQHLGTYNAFLRYSKIGIVLIALLLAGMYMFLV